MEIAALLPQRCIDAIAHTLVHATYQNRWQRSGLVGLINRTLIASDETVVVSVYRRLKGDTYLFQFHTLFDVFFKGQFEQFLVDWCHLRVDGGGITFDPLKSDQYLHHLIDTDLALALVTVKLEGDDRETAKFTMHQKDRSQLSRTVTAISKAFDRQDIVQIITPPGRPNKEHLLARRKATLRAVLKIQRKINPPKLVKLTERDVEVLNFGKTALVGIISKSFEKMSRSPLVQTGYISNILHFSKQFTRSALRYNAYAYDPALIIPEQQELEIADALLRHRNDLPSTVIAGESKTAVARFFQEIVTRDGARAVVQRLSKPLSSGTRSVVEYPLASGFYNAREAPVLGDGFDTINPVLEKDIDAAHFRNAALRRILWLMEPSDERNHRLVQVPIRISGAPALCVMSVVRSNKHEGDTRYDPEKPFWHSHYLINSLIDQFMRPFRIQYREKYVDLMGETLIQSLARVVYYKTHTARSISFDSFIRSVNSDWAALSRIFPYPQFSLSIKPKPGGPLVFCFGHPMALDSRDNTYFDIINPAIYVSPKKVASNLQAAISDFELKHDPAQVGAASRTQEHANP